MRKILNVVAPFALVLWLPTQAHAWWDETHMAIMRAADAPYSACLAIVPDALVGKKPTESANHFYNGAAGAEVTPQMVREQVARYDQPDPAGHLYGAIVAAFRATRAVAAAGKRSAYAYGYLAHYVGDLSQPLHTLAYDTFNKVNHGPADGIVNQHADLEGEIRKRMQPMVIKTEDDLVREIATLANASHALADQMRGGKTFTEEQALQQLGRSASLLRALTLALDLH